MNTSGLEKKGRRGGAVARALQVTYGIILLGLAALMLFGAALEGLAL